ncbi:MAG: hypothetical protein VW625_02815 [Perlucidibaca sp.]
MIIKKRQYALCALSLLAASSAQAFSTAVGEPDSLETFMFANDYDTAVDNAFDAGMPVSAASETDAATGAVIGASLDFERVKVNGRTVKTTSIPLSYTMRSDIDPRRQTIASTRLFSSRSGTVDTYGAVAGLALRRPVNDQWTLVPAIGYGYVDTGSGASEVSGGSYSVSLASVYRIRVDRYDVALANQLGHYRTLEYRGQPLPGGKFRPDANNTVARNGIVVSIPTTIADRRLSTEVSYTRTDLLTGHRITGVDYYNEVGVTVGTNRRLANGRAFVRGGLTYLDGQGDVHGWRAKIGYWF